MRPLFIFITLLICALPVMTYAYVMGSGTYRIDSDSINVGGTSFSTSTSFSLGSSVGEIGTGFSSSSIYRMSAGYWIPDNTYISITSPSDANLGAISGLLGGTGNASSTWTVTTNNATGYSLSVVASTSPAMRAPNASIADYAPSTANPDFAFTVAASAAEFGFSPEGAHVVSRFLDNGSACNTGASNTTDACWDGFATTSKSVASFGGSNHPAGTPTVIKYRVQIGNSYIQDSSSLYQAAVTVTAITL